jgi:cellulose synthase/poly-beta-1,6-N-acetylglucosamine synthase-like glycosyltransferase
MIHFYRQKTKNLSAEISVTKLNRAKEFLRNLSEPIDPVYLIEEDKIFQEDYNIYVYQEKPICVVVPTYNNVEDDRYAKNMDSILNQNYKNYRVIVIDDASKD